MKDSHKSGHPQSTSGSSLSTFWTLWTVYILYFLKLLNLLARVYDHIFIKGEPNWGHKLAWKRTKCANTFICSLRFFVLSVFLFYRRCTCFFPHSSLSFGGRRYVCWFFTNEEQKNIGAWRISYFCHVCLPCLWNNYSVPHMPALFMKSLLPRMPASFMKSLLPRTYAGLVYEITIAMYVALVYELNHYCHIWRPCLWNHYCDICRPCPQNHYFHMFIPAFFYEITIATYAGLVYEITTDCWAQNGSTHGRVLATFKRRFL